MDMTSVMGNAGSALSSAMQVEANLALPIAAVLDRGHLRMEDAAPCNHVGFHARLRAQHADQMIGLPPVSVAVASSQCSAIQRLRVIACIHAPFSVVVSFHAKTLRGTLYASPSVFAFWLVDPLLLLRGFLRGLLRGCLLGCFLSCHLPILPFRWVASKLQFEMQLRNV